MATTNPGITSTKKKQSRLLGFLIGFGVFLIVIAIMAVIKVTPYAVYKNQLAGIRIKYPAYWKLIDHPPGGAIVAFATPPQTSMDTFSENANISLQDLSLKPMNLSQFTQTAIRQMTGTFKQSIQVVDSSPDQLAGRPAYRFSYIMRDKTTPVKFLHVWVIVGTKAYTFTYVAAEKDFDVFLGEVDTMLKSLTVL